MPNLLDTFTPELCEEMTGYTFRDMIAMYEDYERMAKDLEAIRDIGEYGRGWQQGRSDTMRAYGIKEEQR
jgi:hypothetical protein